jgi:hypothetical protein
MSHPPHVVVRPGSGCELGVFWQNLVELFPHIIRENRSLITMADQDTDQDPLANREVAQRRFIVSLTKSIWNGCEDKVIMEYGSAKERLINNGMFTKAVIKYGAFGALENEKVAMQLMVLIVDTRTSVLS